MASLKRVNQTDKTGISSRSREENTNASFVHAAVKQEKKKTHRAKTGTVSFAVHALASSADSSRNAYAHPLVEQLQSSDEDEEHGAQRRCNA